MLAPYAVEAERSRGRRYPESPHPYRNDFQRDRDRVIHSRAFRRLEAKTQVFTQRYSDHFRNRLTHTIEVAQISRTIAAQLGLNGDLVEAMALVHDIGHPPFGHAGEKALDTAMRRHGFFFDHNLHALRIVEDFELRYAAFRGLNLTFEVREGIVKHSRDYGKALLKSGCEGDRLEGDGLQAVRRVGFKNTGALAPEGLNQNCRRADPYSELREYCLDRRPPIEAQLIDLTDEIAYNTADLDDGYEARLISIQEISDSVPLFAEFFRQAAREYPEAPDKLQFNEALKHIFDRMVSDLISNTKQRIQQAGIQSLDDVRRHPERLAAFSPQVEQERRQIKNFLYENLYYSPALSAEKEDAERIVSELFAHWMEEPDDLPRSYREKAEQEPLARVICDYIAGMTDPFIYQQYEKYCRV